MSSFFPVFIFFPPFRIVYHGEARPQQRAEDSLLMAAEIAEYISNIRSLLKVLFVEVRSHLVLFPLPQKPGCHVLQSILHRARMIRKAFRCCGMTELPV